MTHIDTPKLDEIALPDWITHTNYNTIELLEISSLIDNEVWITAEKIKLSVKEMKTSHINNCINCLLGKGKSIIPEGYLGGKDKWLKIFNKELVNRQ